MIVSYIMMAVAESKTVTDIDQKFLLLNKIQDSQLKEILRIFLEINPGLKIPNCVLREFGLIIGAPIINYPPKTELTLFYPPKDGLGLESPPICFGRFCIQDPTGEDREMRIPCVPLSEKCILLEDPDTNKLSLEITQSQIVMPSQFFTGTIFSEDGH